MRKERTTRLETRLSQADRERFIALAQARGVTLTELLREAARFYLDHHNDPAQAKKNNNIERRLKAIETRYASILVRVELDMAHIEAIMSSRIEAGKRRETMEVASRVAVKHFNKKLEGVAGELKQTLLSMTGED